MLRRPSFWLVLCLGEGCSSTAFAEKSAITSKGWDNLDGRGFSLVIADFSAALP